jgi:RHS repeat-associated protein
MLVKRKNCYKFSAKELDNETNYSYFGVRYYDSDLSNWISVDPMSDKYPNLSPYNYCAWNPMILVDPDGNAFGDPPVRNIDYSEPYQVIGYNQAWVHDEKYGAAGDEHGYVAYQANSPGGTIPFYYLQQKPMLNQLNTNKSVATRNIEIKNIPFNLKKTSFSDPIQAKDEISKIADRLKNSDENVIIKPNGGFRDYNKYIKTQKNWINKLIMGRGEAIKEELIKQGIDPDRITITPGSPKSGTTSTSFEFHDKSNE